MECKSIYVVDTIAIGWIINTGKAASEMLAIYAAHSISALFHSTVCTVRELSNALPISRIGLGLQLPSIRSIHFFNSFVLLTETRGVVL